MARSFLSTSFGQVHYLDSEPTGANPIAGDPVVLLHQTPRSVDEFAEVIPLLAAKHRVLAIDNPGYGCSDRPAEPPEVEDYAAIVIALLDHLDLAAAHLVGHHTGAVVAIEAAAAHPERAGRLVLSGAVYLDGETRPGDAWLLGLQQHLPHHRLALEQLMGLARLRQRQGGVDPRRDLARLDVPQ